MFYNMLKITRFNLKLQENLNHESEQVVFQIWGWYKKKNSQK